MEYRAALRLARGTRAVCKGAAFDRQQLRRRPDGAAAGFVPRTGRHAVCEIAVLHGHAAPLDKDGAAVRRDIASEQAVTYIDDRVRGVDRAARAALTERLAVEYKVRDGEGCRAVIREELGRAILYLGFHGGAHIAGAAADGCAGFVRAGIGIGLPRRRFRAGGRRRRQGDVCPLGNDQNVGLRLLVVDQHFNGGRADVVCGDVIHRAGQGREGMLHAVDLHLADGRGVAEQDLADAARVGRRRAGQVDGVVAGYVLRLAAGDRAAHGLPRRVRERTLQDPGRRCAAREQQTHGAARREDEITRLDRVQGLLRDVIDGGEVAVAVRRGVFPQHRQRVDRQRIRGVVRDRDIRALRVVDAELSRLVVRVGCRRAVVLVEDPLLACGVPADVGEKLREGRRVAGEGIAIDIVAGL